jgi:predicted transcriptional regulator
MDTMTLKIPDVIKEKLKKFSEKKGISKSEIVRNALIEYLDKDDIIKKGTFMDLAADLAGSVDEKADLSTNKKYLNNYGK